MNALAQLARLPRRQPTQAQPDQPKATPKTQPRARKTRNRRNLIHEVMGERSGRLVALRAYRVSGRLVAQCRCDCGQVVPVKVDNLLSGHSQSCGCLKAEIAATKMAAIKAQGPTHVTHGMTAADQTGIEPGKQRAFRSWQSMLDRCRPDSKHHALYADRGITVCDRWRDFEAFWVDMGPRAEDDASLDRIDNDDGYRPGNCRWTTKQQQAENRRTTRWLQIGEQTRTVADWSRQLGMSRYLIERRYGGRSA